MDKSNYLRGNTLGPAYVNNPNAGQCIPSAPTNSRVRDGLGYMETQVAELHHTITMLEERLDTIMAPVPPQPSGTSLGKDTSGPISPLCDRMSDLNIQVSQAKSRIHELLSRIDL